MTNDELDEELKKTGRNVVDMIRMGRGADGAAITSVVFCVAQMLAEIAKRMPEVKGGK